jgi:ABC-2 type transport system ATP-binding protein
VVADPVVEPVPLRRSDQAASAKPLSGSNSIEAERITKRFRKSIVLDGVSLDVRAGTTFGLLGPNGSGKTTLLRILAGVLTANSGRVTVLGMRPDQASRQIGYMPQQLGVYPRVTVWENMRYFAGRQGAGTAEYIDPALEAVGLLELKHRLVGELSGGTQRRLSLACALAHRPRVLLLDEPTAAVDPLLRIAFWDHFRRLNERGVTIVVTTHAMDEAEQCDQIAFLREGQVLEKGTPAEVCASQQSRSLEEAFLRLARGDRR